MPSRFYIGLMSGTSLDGVDGVLARIHENGQMKVEGHAFRPFDAPFRETLLALNQSGPDELHRAALAGNQVSRHYAQVVGDLLAQTSLKPQDITAVGAHGQTVDKSADLSIVTVQTPDGQTGLPVFSSVAAMAVWNKAARPVPADAIRVALAAASEGNTRIVLDPGSETEFVFRRPAIKAMATQQEWVPSFLNEAVGQAFAEPLDDSEPSVLAIYLESGDPRSRLDGAELQISLKLEPGLNQDEVQALVSRLAEVWSTSEVIAESVDSMQLRLIAAE